MSSRERILSSVRTAITGATAPVVPRGYADRLELDAAGQIALLVERIRDYKADVRVISQADLARTIGNVLGERSASSVVVPADLDPQWLTTVTCEVLRDDPPLDARRLDQVSAVVTSSAVSVALTGTIVLDAGTAQGRRVISLIPDLHICVVPAQTIVGTVPEAVRRLDPVRPLTWISGPSATSDIELNRVEGVHGPRNLVVLIVN
ncbi:LUD domain-containing protein [Microlunatus panaciterrae]|uniref:L-lactate dehydrogenase complex protein LldG n=1 Tax=Microlunatus panaciterrae TaxID=400768 RepID=A0ABS2RGK1_9ACTN|nr:LUD domain-containing protein [Microlunatus panaciterrae]MBM7798134.1 L-lactate dehydrogenase complex protein LldG [Microlunatus panaciterrae]